MTATENKPAPHPLHEFWQTYPKAVQWQLQWLLTQPEEQPEPGIIRILLGTIILGTLFYGTFALFQQTFVYGHMLLVYGGVLLLALLPKALKAMGYDANTAKHDIAQLEHALTQTQPPRFGKVTIKKVITLLHLRMGVGFLTDLVAPNFHIVLQDDKDQQWETTVIGHPYPLTEGFYEKAEFFFHPSKSYPVLIIANKNVMVTLHRSVQLMRKAAAHKTKP